MKMPITVKCPSCSVESVEDFENCNSWNDPGLQKLSDNQIRDEYAKLQAHNDDVSVMCTPCKSGALAVVQSRNLSAGTGHSSFAFSGAKSAPDQSIYSEPVMSNFDQMSSQPGVSKTFVTERVEKVTSTFTETPIGFATEPFSASAHPVQNASAEQPVKVSEKEKITEGAIAWMIIIVLFGLSAIAVGGYFFMKFFGKL